MDQFDVAVGPDVIGIVVKVCVFVGIDNVLNSRDDVATISMFHVETKYVTYSFAGSFVVIRDRSNKYFVLGGPGVDLVG